MLTLIICTLIILVVRMGFKINKEKLHSFKDCKREFIRSTLLGFSAGISLSVILGIVFYFIAPYHYEAVTIQLEAFDETNQRGEGYITSEYGEEKLVNFYVVKTEKGMQYINNSSRVHLSHDNNPRIELQYKELNGLWNSLCALDFIKYINSINIYVPEA